MGLTIAEAEEFPLSPATGVEVVNSKAALHVLLARSAMIDPLDRLRLDPGKRWRACPARFSWYHAIMAKSTNDTTKPRKRPAQSGTPVMVRLQPDQIQRLDNWRKGQAELPSRPEAIRRLVEHALGNSKDA